MSGISLICHLRKPLIADHCHSSPQAEVRIPRRAAARAYFLVINKSAGQFYLSFDTR